MAKARMLHKLKHNYPPSMKDFYRISKERLEIYLYCLAETTEIIRRIRPKGKKDKVWDQSDKAWDLVIEVFNGLYGFKHYENAQAGGKVIQDTFLYDEGVELDNDKFFKIEFPKGIEEEVKP